MGHPDLVKSLAAALTTVRVSLGNVLGCVVEGHFLKPMPIPYPLPQGARMGLFYPLTCRKPDQGKKIGWGGVSKVFFIPWKMWPPPASPLLLSPLWPRF